MDTPHIRQTVEPRAQAALDLFDALLQGYGPRDFGLRLWDGTERPADPGQRARFTFVINRPDALWRMFVPPGTRAVGEAYVNGDFDIEGDLIEVVDVVAAILKRATPMAVARLLPRLWRMRSDAAPDVLPGKARLSGRIHNPERDKVAVRHHYDISNDFFALWLDARMVYSCSYFPTGTETLDESQEHKLELICRKLRLKEGERFLDLGCGYGGLVMYAAERHGVQALGVTLSEKHGLLAQERVRQKGLEGRCRIEIMDYRQLPPGQRFDKIAAIGISEHVGEIQLGALFRRVWELLEPGGLFLNHCICWPGDSPRWKRALTQTHFLHQNFILRYVFPDLDLVPIDVLLRAGGRAGFEVRDVENLRPHYAITLRHWLERLNANWARVVDEVGLPTARVYRAYLAYCSWAFAANKNCLMHSLFAKPAANGRVDLPLTRADLYR